jgi:hypothetical protein
LRVPERVYEVFEITSPAPPPPAVFDAVVAEPPPPPPPTTKTETLVRPLGTAQEFTTDVFHIIKF